MTDLYLAARELVGVDFQHRGRDPDSALDCIGLVASAAARVGWDVSDVPNDYPRRPGDQQGVLEHYLERHLGPPVLREPVRLEDLRPNDVVAMHFDHVRVGKGMRSKRAVKHIGVVGEFRGRLTLIHTDGRVGRRGGAGRVAEQGIDDTILADIAAVYRK